MRPVYYGTGLTESEAYRIEKILIEQYGRLIDGSGKLFNVLEGGEDEVRFSADFVRFSPKSGRINTVTVESARDP